MYWKAVSIHPPWQPKLSSTQSTSCCSDKETSLPVFLACCPSSDPVCERTNKSLRKYNRARAPFVCSIEDKTPTPSQVINSAASSTNRTSKQTHGAVLLVTWAGLRVISSIEQTNQTNKEHTRPRLYRPRTALDVNEAYLIDQLDTADIIDDLNNYDRKSINSLSRRTICWTFEGRCLV